MILGKIALNYIYLSKSHAGGKDQVGLNLLRGLHELGVLHEYVIFCYPHSVKQIRSISPEVEISEVKEHAQTNELFRLLDIIFANTFVIRKLLKRYGCRCIFHLSCMNGLRGFRVPSVVIPHDIKAVAHRILGAVKIPLFKYFFYRIMYAMDFRHADAIIAISRFDQGEMEQYYPQYKHKIRQIYNPIVVCDEARVYTVEERGNITALNIQFHHKNTITLIKAFEKIKNDIQDNLVLVGKVPQRMQYLVDYVKEHNLEGRVIFTGFLSETELQEAFQKSRLYVNPTLYEGFGMTAVEAVIRGIPALISKVASNEEVTQGLCDYYFPADDEESLAEAICKCLKKEYSIQEMKRKGEILRKRYDHVHIARCYHKLFLEMSKEV